MLTLMDAYDIACRIVESETPRAQTTAGSFVDDWNQVRPIPNSTPFEHIPREQRPQPEKVTPSPGLGGTPCTEHREKVHVFADGTEKRACSATGCLWGQPIGNHFRKKHSDKIMGGTIYSADVLDFEPEVEITEDAKEITIPTFGVGSRDDQFEPEPDEQEPVEEVAEDEEYDDE